MAPPYPAKPKRVSPYFAFCKKHRDDVKSRLQDACQPTSASAIAKALSELWRSLSDAEKQKYKISGSEVQESTGDALPEEGNSQDLSENQKTMTPEDGDPDVNAAVVANLEDRATNDDEDSESHCHVQAISTESEPCADRRDPNPSQGHEEGANLAFPLTRLKRIIKLDKDIKIVAADSSLLIAHASQLFLELLTEASYNVAQKKKHKSLRLDDIRAAIKSAPRIDDFLSEALEDIFIHRKEENESDSGDDADNHHVPNSSSNKKPKVAKKPPPEPPSGTRSIADFFVAAKSVPAETSNVDELLK